MNQLFILIDRYTKTVYGAYSSEVAARNVASNKRNTRKFTMVVLESNGWSAVAEIDVEPPQPAPTPKIDPILLAPVDDIKAQFQAETGLVWRADSPEVRAWVASKVTHEPPQSVGRSEVQAVRDAGQGPRSSSGESPSAGDDRGSIAGSC